MFNFVKCVQRTRFDERKTTIRNKVRVCGNVNLKHVNTMCSTTVLFMGVTMLKILPKEIIKYRRKNIHIKDIVKI